MRRVLSALVQPPHLGFYALSGRITAFAGPALFGLVTGLTGSQRWGMARVLPFLVAGAVLLIRPLPPRRDQDEEVSCAKASSRVSATVSQRPRGLPSVKAASPMEASMVRRGCQ